MHGLPPIASPTLDVPLDDEDDEVFSLDALPQMTSRPGAPARVYLDFNGAAAQQWGTFNTTQTPAYDLDGDPTTYNRLEMNGITEIFNRVAEKYSPFNVSVTTVDPEVYNYNETTRVVIGGDGKWAGGTFGGYGYVGGFTGSTSNTVWVFAKNLGKGLPKYVAEAAAHEAGHSFGLSHQSSYNENGVKTDEYNRGDGKRAPIMGFSYFAERGVWWKGSTFGAGFTQDDLAIIIGFSNGFGFAPDDHGSDALTAKLLNIIDGIEASDAGIIERGNDKDYFKFSTTGGTASLRADVAELGPMLDLKLSLEDVNGAVLAHADTDSLGEFIEAHLAAGDYYLVVESHRAYGDLGSYRISGQVVPEPSSAAVVLLAGVGWLMQRKERKARKEARFSWRLIERSGDEDELPSWS